MFTSLLLDKSTSNLIIIVTIYYNLNGDTVSFLNNFNDCVMGGRDYSDLIKMTASANH